MPDTLTNAAPIHCFDAALVARFGPINVNTAHIKGNFPKKYQVYETAKGKQNIDLVQRMASALQTHDIDAHDEIWAEDLIWHGPPGFGTVYGLKVINGRLSKAYSMNCCRTSMMMLKSKWPTMIGLQSPVS